MGRLRYRVRRASPSVSAAVATALLVAGCSTTTQPPARSAVPLPGGFSASGGDSLPARWWHHFEDPGLNQALDRVVADNFSLAAARARLTQARAAARVAAGGLLPSLDATADAAARDGDGAVQAGEDYAAGAAASYELDLWGRLAASAEAAAREAEASEGDLRAAGISLTAEAATAYYGILRQRALRDLIRAQAKTNRRVEELVELRYRNGAANVDELLRQRQLVESTSADLATVLGELARRRAELAALQGLPGPSAVSVPRDAGLVEVPPLPDTGLPATWLNRRPDLAAAWLRVRAADAELAAAIAAQYPRVDLTASVESAASSPSALFEDWIGRLAAGLTVPLFRGGELEAEVDRTRAARAVAFNEYAQATLDAVAEVENALQAERTDRQRIESLSRQVDLGERVLEQLRFRYRNGAADYLDVLEAQTTLQNTERSLLQARWDLVVDRIQLARIIAGGWRADGGGTPAGNG